MATEVMEKPLQYLDKAVGAIRDLGIWPEASAEQPITGLLNEIMALDETKVILIGRTLTQASAFNEVVRSQVAAMWGVRRAAPTPPGSAQQPRLASSRGQCVSRSTRREGRSTSASPGAAAKAASDDAAGGACRPRDASRPTFRAVRPPGKSSPPDPRRTAGRPSSGSARGRSDLPDRGI